MRFFKKPPVVLFGYQFVPWRLAAAQLLKCTHLTCNAKLNGYCFYKKPQKSWLKLFKKAGCPLVLNCPDDPDAATVKEARQLLAPIRNETELLSIAINGCRIGDLVIDTFLNAYNCATLETNDEKLVPILAKALQIAETTIKYFDRSDCRAVITDQSGFYIYNGVTARLAHLRSIPVYDMIYMGRLGLFRVEFPENQRGACSNPYWKLRERFRNLTEQAKHDAFVQAENILQLRLSGAVDNSTLPSRSAYQSVSGSAGIEINAEPKARSFLVFLHEFSDAPHCYRWGLFDNFYQWIEYVLDFASRHDIRVYVKPHPASFNFGRSPQKVLSDSMVEQLKIKYPNAVFLDGSTSNHCLRLYNPDLVLTVHGTIAHEMAYLSEAVVNAGDNPHIQYTFCAHPTTIQEYENILAGTTRAAIVKNKRDILEFIYMRYIYPLRYLNEASFNPSELEFEERSHCSAEQGLKLSRGIVNRCLS